MPIKRIMLNVAVDVPKRWTIARVHEDVLQILKLEIPDQNPEVIYVGVAPPIAYPDMAIEVTLQNYTGLHETYQESDLRVGWFLVKSEDPTKHALALPPHIFRKCFRWTGDQQLRYPNEFAAVEEI